MNQTNPSLLFPFIAPPNGGKGTQTNLISKRFGLPKVDMGGLLRAVGKEDSPLGNLVRQTQAQGKLVEIATVMDVLKDGLQKLATQSQLAQPAFILDGFPRSLEQAERLVTLCNQMNAQVAQVIYIHVPDEVIVSRAVNRRLCEVCGEIYNLVSQPPKQPGLCDHDGSTLLHRSDDYPEKVTVRLQAYQEETQPLIDFYRQQGVLSQIDGNRDVSAITTDILAVLDRFVALQATL